MKETATGTYYDGKIETIKYLEYIIEALVKNGVEPSKAYNVAMALKYLSSRLGAKDPVDVELLKAENYIHRARTGEWLPKELLGKSDR